MDTFLHEYLGEIIMGTIMIIIGWSIRNWADTIQRSNKDILSRVSALALEFHNYRVTTENRVTKVEEKVYHLEKTFFITLANNADGSKGST